MADQHIPSGDAAAIISTVKALAPAQMVDVGGRSVLVVQSGQQVHEVKKYLDTYLTNPERRTGTARLDSLESFSAFALKFKDDGSVIYADRNVPSLTFIEDYNTASQPRFGEHRGSYAFPLSDEWALWTTTNRRMMDQKTFAEFVEARISDVSDAVSPSGRAAEFANKCGVHYSGPSILLDVSKGMELNANIQIKQARKLQSGESEFSYVESHESKGFLKIPGAFLIAIPVFRGGACYEIPVRLRYRVDGGAVKWFFELHRPEVFFDHAFTEACTKAGEATTLPVFMGAPEEAE
jgi:uncharacterized protein YfdQ (DUF2303 family)